MVNVRVQFDNWLAPSQYRVTPSISRAGVGDALDVREDLATLAVHGPRFTGGSTDLQHEFQLERG